MRVSLIGAVLFSTALLTASGAAWAQAAEDGGQEKPVKRPPPFCENNPHFGDFDFWLGEWRVYSRDDHVLQGHNSVRKRHAACLVEENWTAKGGGSGTSINYYNPLTQKWRQVWVSDGYSLDISGGRNAAGAMVLEGRIDYYRRGESYPFRGAWTLLEDGSVRQYFQQYDPDKKSWVDWFDGLYIKAGKNGDGK